MKMEIKDEELINKTNIYQYFVICVLYFIEIFRYLKLCNISDILQKC